MNEINYLVFLLNNRLNESYSMGELKREVKIRIFELIKNLKECPECKESLGISDDCPLCIIFNIYSQSDVVTRT